MNSKMFRRLLVLAARVAQGLAIRSSQPITVEIGFGDVLVTGVLDFVNTQACSIEPSHASRSVVVSVTSQFVAASQVSTAISPTSALITPTDQVHPTNTLFTLPDQTKATLAAIPVMNITNRTASLLQPSPVFTSGGSGGRPGLIRLVEALRILNR